MRELLRTDLTQESFPPPPSSSRLNTSRPRSTSPPGSVSLGILPTAHPSRVWRLALDRTVHPHSVFPSPIPIEGVLLRFLVMEQTLNSPAGYAFAISDHLREVLSADSSSVGHVRSNTTAPIYWGSCARSSPAKGCRTGSPPYTLNQMVNSDEHRRSRVGFKPFGEPLRKTRVDAKMESARNQRKLSVGRTTRS